MTTELKTCPWCGSPGVFITTDPGKNGGCVVMCKIDCDMSCQTDWHDSEASAAAQWNRRASAPPVATEPQRILIALAGEKGSGKDTAAKALVEVGFRNAKMAGGLKEMLRAYLRYRLAPEALIERMLEGDLKETPSPYLNGRTPRHAMQTLGTEWGRERMSPTFWIDALRDHLGPVRRAVITDVRFPNEADWAKAQGATVIGVERQQDRPLADQHASETQIAGLRVDARLVNDCPSAPDFTLKARAFFAGLFQGLASGLT